MPRDLLDALSAAGPHPDHRDGLQLFGRFVGSWDVDGRFFDEDGSVADEHRAEWHFGWALGGRAVQDVLVRPDEIGTTLRVYDPGSGAWRIVWIAAVSGRGVDLAARADGDDILIEGTGPEGAPYRWTFSEISDDAFVWQGFQSEDGGASWFRGQEMRCRRRAPAGTRS